MKRAHMNKNLNQRGSAHVVVIICLVLALLTSLGWIFYQNFIAGDTTKKETELLVVEKDKKTTDSDTLEIKELGLTVDLKQAPHEDVTYTMTGLDLQQKDKNVIAAIYSKNLNERLVVDARLSSTATEREKLTCNRAVYAFYQIPDENVGAPGEAVDPDNKPEGAELYVGFVGPCAPSDEKLSEESIAFRDWAKTAVKE